jgi:hypothetical protein
MCRESGGEIFGLLRFSAVLLTVVFAIPAISTIQVWQHAWEVRAKSSKIEGEAAVP